MALFETGQIVTTKGIATAMASDSGFRNAVQNCLYRHCRGDWGDVEEESWQQNEDALESERNGGFSDTLFSVYDIDGTEIFIITEIDRSATTILFPDEY